MYFYVFLKKVITVNGSFFSPPLNIMYQYRGEFTVPRPEAYSEPSRISKMELFTKIVNGFQPLIIFSKSFILDVWLGSLPLTSIIVRSCFGMTAKIFPKVTSC